MKNRILLENYFLPGDLEAQIPGFVNHYHQQLYHERVNNVTPVDVYFGRDKAILKKERIKRKTLEVRRLHHSQQTAQFNRSDEPNSPLVQPTIGSKNPDDG